MIQSHMSFYYYHNSLISSILQQRNLEPREAGVSTKVAELINDKGRN